MKIVETTHYECSTCHQLFNSEREALDCEKQPITQDLGVKVGDIVRIVRGDGAGFDGRVEEVCVIKRDWGHYLWNRYWHTIGLTVKVVDGYGHRFLTFDDYDL